MEYSLHGADYERLYRQYNIKMPRKVIDFSTNTSVVEPITLDIDLGSIISVYPDNYCIKLRTILSKINQVSLDEILVTNGSNEAIYLIASMLEGKKVGIIEPAYPEYRRALEAYNIQVQSINKVEIHNNTTKIESNEIRFEALIDLEKCYLYDCIFICNPNNPTGQYIGYESLLNIARKLANKNIQLIIDEAYIDFLPSNHKMIDIGVYKNVYILRSLTKSFQLAGARIGYVMSSKENIDKLQKRQPTWSVNGIAEQLSIQYLRYKNYIPKMKAFYKETVIKVISSIRAIGYTVIHTDIHYFLLKVNDDEFFIRFMLQKGIVVRHTRNHLGLNGKYVRIAVRTNDENLLLLEALMEYENISY